MRRHMFTHSPRISVSLTALLLLVALIACKGSKGGEEGSTTEAPKGLYVDLGEGKQLVEPKTAVAKLRPDLRQLQVLVANYENAVTDSIMAADQAKEPGQLKVAFYVKGEGKEFKQPVEPGEYTGQSIHAAYVSQGGESSDIGFISSGKTPDGKVVFTKIDETQVVGTIEIKHEGKAISGTFTAKFLPED